jgi:hypothetical protein
MDPRVPDRANNPAKRSRSWASDASLRTLRVDPARQKRVALGVVGTLGTLALHALLLSPLLLGAGLRAHRMSDEQGFPSEGAPAMTVLNLEEEDRSSGSDARDAQLSIVSPARFLMPVGGPQWGTLGALAPIEAELAHAVPDEGQADEAGRAVMFGRYLGQVTARVDRAWLRPRGPIGAVSFECRVQVEQDAQRNVKEITLKECNGSTSWQLSLVQAIESASPFPAPPDPSVFSKVLTFQMTAQGFREGGSTEGFDPNSEGADTLEAAADGLKRVVNELRRRDTSTPGTISLRIEGVRSSDAGASPLPAAPAELEEPVAQ